MALSAATVFEVRTAGSDTLCSGGFVAGASGTDYSQQDAAQYTGTNLVIDGAVNTKVTSATHNFVAADVGNLLQITAGSGFTTGFFEIVSVAANAATLDRSAGTLGSTAGTFAVGGAIKSPAIASSVAVSQNTIWVKSGTYTMSVGTINVVNGLVSLAGRVAMRGYQTTRGDDAARPLFLASGIASVTLVALGSNDSVVWNIEVDGASLTGIRGISSAGAFNFVYYCLARNCKNVGVYIGSTGSYAVRCYATGCSTTYGFADRNFLYCEAYANTAGGFDTEFGTMMGCLSHGNTGLGIYIDSNTYQVVNCTAYNNTTNGFQIGGNTHESLLINCVAYLNGAYGFDYGSSSIISFAKMLKCAAGANTTANRRGSPPTLMDDFITLTADPFTNAAGRDFSLNNTAGGGVLLRNLGRPGLLAGGVTSNLLDIGAAQHADAGGGGGTGPNVIVSSGAGSRGGSW